MLELIDTFFLQHPAIGSICSAVGASVITVFLKGFVESYFQEKRERSNALRQNRKDMFDNIYSPLNALCYEVRYRDGSCDRLEARDVQGIFDILNSNRQYVDGELEKHYGNFLDWEESCMMVGVDSDYPDSDAKAFYNFILSEYKTLKKEIYGTSS